LNGKPVYVIGAGAVYDGRGLAANLMWGAQAVCKGRIYLSCTKKLIAPCTGVGTVCTFSFLQTRRS
jgi:NAD(P)H-dependent flavin oxidoreductase YrpB (nitropropane dioxygenase family)